MGNIKARKSEYIIVDRYLNRVTLNERNHQSIDSNELNNNILWNIISINQQVKCEKQSHLAHTCTTPKE